MQNAKNFVCSLLFGAVVSLATFSANAGFWDWLTPYQGPDKDIITLIITGNFTKSRLLADLIQLETKQPILLLPSTPGGQIFFIPAKDEAMEVVNEDFSRFVKFINPKQILILGDTRYVPKEYIDKIDPSQTIWNISNKNWQEVAVSAGKILDITNLAGDFKKLCEDIDSGKLYRAGGDSLPVAEETEAAVPVEEPVAVPEEPVLIKDTEIIPK